MSYALKRGTLAGGRSWSDPAVADLSELEWTDGVGAYPMDFSRDVKDSLLTDAAGIPMIDYANLGCHYNPWFVGHIALGVYTLWRRRRRPGDREQFLRLARWFSDNAERSGSFAFWLYRFDWFGDEAGWFSGLSQAHAISVLLRAFDISRDGEYAKLARAAADCMIAEIDDGGTASWQGDNTVFFQEHRRNPPAYILNGHLFSCFAIREAAHYFRELRYRQAARAGFDYLDKNLSKFDLGFWSRYSLQVKKFGVPDIASRHYHDVHIAQLRVAGAMSGSKTIRGFSDKFAEYQRRPSAVRKAGAVKCLAKLL